METRTNPLNSNWFYGLIVIFYLIVAYNSSGFNHWDEHYQIIEFANYKLGRANPGDLAWEFSEQIRPGLQPLLCYLVLKAISLLGCRDPFFSTFILRGISAVASIIAIRRFLWSCRGQVSEKNLLPFFLLSFFLWFIPYLSVRFSSECWSGIFFTLALSFIQSPEVSSNKKILMIGMCLGLSILFRYQSVILAAGICAWFLFIVRLPVKKLYLLSASILAVIISGLFIDRWFYGEYCFTMFNYFKVNLLDGVAASFGTSPWYYIVLYIIRGPGLILGLLLFNAIILFCYFRPKHVLVWSAVPFLIIHAVIAHKELRFLYPLANVIPFVMVMAWQDISSRIVFGHGLIKCSLGVILVAVNIVGLVAINLKGAGLGRIALAEKIYRRYPRSEINLMYSSYGDPYTDWIPPRNTFYRNRNVTRRELKTVSRQEILANTEKSKINLLAVPDQAGKNFPVAKMLHELKFVSWFQSIPDILTEVNNLYDPSINGSGITVYLLEEDN